MSLAFRWLGAAGIELKSAGQVLVLDPFFTRPTLLQMLRPVTSDVNLVLEKLPTCNYVLVTHAHYDHLLDVPSVLRHTGAIAYGSANTCQLLSLHGISTRQVKQVRVGDRLSLGEFQVEVIAGQHSPVPFDAIFNGRLPGDVHPPLHVQDYRMEVCLGYCIMAGGVRVLVCAARPLPVDLLFTVAQESEQYYLQLFRGATPSTFVPIHWDNFTRPLNKPLRRFTRPGRISLMQLVKLAQHTLPGVNVIVPELFKEYNC